MATLIKGLSLLITLAALAVNAHADEIDSGVDPGRYREDFTAPLPRSARPQVPRVEPLPAPDPHYTRGLDMEQADGTGVYQPNRGGYCHRSGSVLNCDN